MQIRFPTERVAWNNYVEKLLTELRVDYARLWQVLPQLPDPEAGIPYTGPLVPSTFCWPYQQCAQDEFPACDATCLRFVVSGVTNASCSNCSTMFNRSVVMDFWGRTSSNLVCWWRSDAFSLGTCSGFYGVASGRWFARFQSTNGTWHVWMADAATLIGTFAPLDAEYTVIGQSGLSTPQSFPLSLDLVSFAAACTNWTDPISLDTCQSGAS